MGQKERNKNSICFWSSYAGADTIVLYSVYGDCLNLSVNLHRFFFDSNFGFDRKYFKEFTDLYMKKGLHKTAACRSMIVASFVDDD